MHGAMKEVVAHVQRALHEAGVQSGDTVVVAASGGCDSTTLLHVLEALGQPMVVAHVDHGARGEESAGDRAFVEGWAQQRGLRFEVLTLKASSLKQGAQGFQGEARKRRLAWLESLRQAHGAAAILTGHHADDQAETWLLHAMRSPDPWAVRGMALREGQVVRPLLDLSRQEIEAAARLQGWSWREDSSNRTDAYLRNRVRHEVLPLLDDLRPGTSRHLSQLARRAAEKHEDLFKLVSEARQIAEVAPGTWAIDTLQHKTLCRNALRNTLTARGWSDALASEVLALVNAQVGAQVLGRDARVVRERLHLIELPLENEGTPTSPKSIPLSVAHESGSVTTALGTCSWAPAKAPKNAAELHSGRCWIPATWLPVVIRPWADGDRIQPLGMTGHSLVSDVLTQAKTPHAHRSEALLLERPSSPETQEDSAHVLWVVGHKLGEQARLHLDQLADAPGLLFTFEAHPLS